MCGESTEYERLDVQAFLDEVNGRAVFTEKLSDSLNYYCTADLPYSVELYGTEINLHICIKQGGVTVASPIIFGAVLKTVLVAAYSRTFQKILPAMYKFFCTPSINGVQSYAT